MKSRQDAYYVMIPGNQFMITHYDHSMPYLGRDPGVDISDILKLSHTKSIAKDWE